MGMLQPSSRVGMVLLAALVLTSGCASHGTTHVDERPGTPLRRYRTAVVEVTSTVDAAGDVVSQLAQAILRQLRAQQVFAHVAATAASPDHAFDLIVAVQITDVRRVDLADRLQRGALAGRGALEATVALIDGRSQQTFAKAKVTGSTAVDLLFSGTTVQAVQRAAEHVVAFVAQYR
jgi:hypothetical protein